MAYQRFRLTVALALAATAANAASAAELIQNGGFEATTTAASAGSSGGFAYPNGTFDGWTYDIGSGLIDGMTGTGWFGGNPPAGYAGAQYAFLQANGSLSQTFTADASGSLTVSWLEGARPASPFNNGDQIYSVSIGGTLLGTFSSTSGQAFQARSASPFAVTAGQSYTLTFQGLTNTDRTAFLDQVSASVAPVPEPGEWAMMAVGLGIAVTAARRRRRG